MDQPAGADGVVDVETALQREIDNLAERFPDLDRGEIDDQVHHTYQELERNASIHTYLVTVTAAHVGDVLHNRGEHYQRRSAVAPPANAAETAS
jgi:hypothetical protein